MWLLLPPLFCLADYLEARAKGQASTAIRKLLELSAKVAHRQRDNGSIEDIPADQVQEEICFW